MSQSSAQYATYNSANLLTSSNVTQMTISAWIKPIDIVNFRPVAVVSSSQTDANTYRNMYIDLRNAGLHVQSGNCNKDTANVLQAGKWQHVAFTLNGVNGKVYVNGKLVDTVTCNSADQLSFQPRSIYIGNLNLGNLYFNGSIDDVVVYTQALASKEVEVLYARGLQHHSVALK